MTSSTDNLPKLLRRSSISMTNIPSSADLLLTQTNSTNNSAKRSSLINFPQKSSENTSFNPPNSFSYNNSITNQNQSFGEYMNSLVTQKYFYVEKCLIIPIIALLYECDQQQIIYNIESISRQIRYLLIKWLDTQEREILDPVFILSLKNKLINIKCTWKYTTSFQPSTFQSCILRFNNAYDALIQQTISNSIFKSKQYRESIEMEKKLMNHYINLLDSFLTSIVIHSKEIEKMKYLQSN